VEAVSRETGHRSAPTTSAPTVVAAMTSLSVVDGDGCQFETPMQVDRAVGACKALVVCTSRQRVAGASRRTGSVAAPPVVAVMFGSQPPHSPREALARTARRMAVTAGLSLLCWLLAAAVPVPAFAHAELVRTSPIDGQRLDVPPAEVVLEFTEPVRLIVGGIRLLDSGGQPLSTAAPQVDGVRVTLPLSGDLPSGTYVVSWRVLSSDTHPVAGALAFGVGTDPPLGAAAASNAVQPAAPGVSSVLVAGRWIGYAGLALLLGGTVFLLVCWPRGRTLQRTRRLVAAGWVCSVAATILGLLVQGPL
jgi:methionine-rich copper-binding protein CopC